MSDETRDIITGRLTRDPIVKQKVTFLNIGKNIKLQDGSYGKTLWVKIICFKEAKKVADGFAKGDIVRAHGELYCGEDYETNTGEKRLGEAEFKCFKLEKVERRARQNSESFDDAEPAPRREAAPAPRREAPPAAPAPGLDDSDCPF